MCMIAPISSWAAAVSSTAEVWTPASAASSFSSRPSPTTSTPC
ncbi:MAG: hypothetical protein ACLU38_01635 [Dysosmobacter sp.]